MAKLGLAVAHRDLELRFHSNEMPATELGGSETG